MLLQKRFVNRVVAICVEHELRLVGLQKEADLPIRSHGHQEAVDESGSKVDSTFEFAAEQ